ncbi:glycoside hydrolase family 3 N-terminal domain-containing protein [Candidatus Izemoplasma sp. B36]|uniref:glycoside hydrolase family 3 N-terminal domain-containing protein n=1 Tax=Candidatus Izemoplasma sp. B36 TaxID=3242468 RepID=UPI003558BF85
MQKKKEIDLNQILNNLTMKEKIGQLLQIAPFYFIRNIDVEIFGWLRELNLNEEKIFNAGSVLGIGSAKDMIEVQTKYLSKSRHKIPLIFMADIIHGYKTIFPVPIALASSFNEELVTLSARLSAEEASTAGIHVTFSPMADLSRDPRWGRVVEGFGEDPVLSSRMAAAMVKGYIGEGIDKEYTLTPCVKHFAGYGACDGGRDYNTVNISNVDLFNMHLKPYKSALDAGSRLIMAAFNTLNGIPCTVNSFLLKNILRDKWQSDAVTISDYDGSKQVIAHGVAKDTEEVAYKAIKSGLDIEMQSTTYSSHLETLIDNGLVDVKLLDEAVYRVLKLKKDIGIFDNPFKGAVLDDSKIVLTEDKLLRSKQIAHESLVMLKNDGVLPLKKDCKIALIGPYADSRNIIGPWSWHGKRDLHESLYEVLLNHVIFMKTEEDICKYSDSDIDIIKKADVILFALGESDWLSGEAHSRTDINLPNNQAKLLEIANISKLKSVVLLFNGRPLTLNNIQKADSIIECWFLGSKSSEAIKDVIFGNINPSGKLPISFPRNVGQIPIYYNHLNTGRPLTKNGNNEYVSKYLDSPNEPLYPFGYGLSYSNFEYKDMKLSKTKMKLNDVLVAQVEVVNNSKYNGKETVQLYIKDHFAEISRPVMELIAFKKIQVEAYQRAIVKFKISINDLMYFDSLGNKKYDLGKFSVMIGTSSVEYLVKEFELVE